MTTIAVDGKTIAADRQGCGPFKWEVQEPKIWRVEHHSDFSSPFIIGCAGSVEARYRFADWLNVGGQKPQLPESSFEAISIHADGTIQYWSAGIRPFPVSAPHAIGSGERFAMGALLAGAEAKEAISIAIMLDEGSGGQVDVMSLESDGDDTVRG